jgi:hypothetical protein
MINNEEKKLILLVDNAPANIQVAREILKDSYKSASQQAEPKRWSW